MPKIASLSAEVSADVSKFERGMNQARDSMGKFVTGTKEGSKEASDAIKQITESATAPVREATARIAALSREVALNGDKTRKAAAEYDILHGALKGATDEEKKQIVTLSELADKQEAARKGTGDFARGMKDGGESANKLGGILQTFVGGLLVKAVDLFLRAGKAAIEFGNQCAEAASDVNESVSKIQTLFGKSADSVEQWSKSTAGSIGLSRRASLEAAGNYGNLFRAMDFGQQMSSQFSTRLVQMAADMASFNNTSLEQALDAIRSGLVGESEPLRQFGVMLSEAALKQEALQMGLTKTTKDALTPQQKALTTMSLLTKQAAAAQGDFAKTAGGAANAQRILAARFEDLKTKIGEVTLPLKAQAIAGLNALMERVNAIDFKGAIEATRQFFGAVVSWITDKMKPATDFFLGLWNQLVAWFQENLPLIQRTVETVVGFITQFWHDHGAQIVAIVTALWNQVKNRFQQGLAIILGLVKAVMQLITGDWKGMFKTLWEVVQNLWKFLVDTFKNIGQLVVSSLQFVLSTLYDLLARLFTTLGNGIANAIKAVGEWIGGLFVDSIEYMFGEKAVALAAKIGEWVFRVAKAAKEALGFGTGTTVVDASRLGGVIPSGKVGGGLGDVRATEGRESGSNFGTVYLDQLRKTASGFFNPGKSTAPKLPSMTDLLKGVKNTDHIAGSDDDKDGKKHTEKVLTARQELADKIAKLTLSQWDVERREVRQYVAEYVKKTGDVVKARQYEALAMADIAKRQQAAEPKGAWGKDWLAQNSPGIFSVGASLKTVLQEHKKQLQGMSDVSKQADEAFLNASQGENSVASLKRKYPLVDTAVLAQLSKHLTETATKTRNLGDQTAYVQAHWNEWMLGITNAVSGGALSLVNQQSDELAQSLHENMVEALRAARVELAGLLATTDEGRLSWAMYGKALADLDSVQRANLDQLAQVQRQTAYASAVQETSDQLKQLRAHTLAEKIALEVYHRQLSELTGAEWVNIQLLRTKREEVEKLEKQNARRTFWKGQFAGVTGENFLDSLTNGVQGMKRFWADVVNTGRQALIKLGWSEVIQPQLKGLFSTLKEGLNGSLQGIVGAAGTIINAAYGLLSAMGANGKKRQWGSIIGGVLGGIAAVATGGAALPFISAGMSLGGAFAGGNIGEILMTGLSTASSFGAFNTGKAATGGNTLPDGSNLNARFKGITVEQNIYGPINNAADLDSVNASLGSNLESALRVPG